MTDVGSFWHVVNNKILKVNVRFMAGQLMSGYTSESYLLNTLCIGGKLVFDETGLWHHHDTVFENNEEHF